jgi:hypothetical protein
LFFGLFRETNKVFFRFVSVFRINIETTETNRSVSKQPKKKINGLFFIQYLHDALSISFLKIQKCLATHVFIKQIFKPAEIAPHSPAPPNIAVQGLVN